MASSDSGETRRSAAKTSAGAPPPPPEQTEHLPCPRCDSTNTKFCYYNNYNYSQPRHFCKSCRRYWTQGGTLRDIPVGGGSRKNAKRSRTATHHHHHASSTTATSSSSSAVPSAPVALVPNQGGVGPMPMQLVDGCDVKHNVNANVCGGSFTSLLSNTQTTTSGFLGLSGFGLGLGHGFEDVAGFGIGRIGWTFPGTVDGANVGGSGATVVASGATWQLEGGDGGFVNGDCFSWPGLAISTPGNGLK